MSYSPSHLKHHRSNSRDHSPDHGRQRRPHVTVVMGHSFARRLGEYTERSGRQNMEFSRSKRIIHFHGVSGSKLRDFQLQMPDVIERLSPNCVTLQVAGNDLTSESVSPSRVIDLIKESCKMLRKLGVSRVIINRLFYRDVDKVRTKGWPIRSDYNKIVDQVNRTLESWCVNQDGIKFKEYKRSKLFRKTTWKKYICPDGVHLNDEGMARYYKRIRKTINKV